VRSKNYASLKIILVTKQSNGSPLTYEMLTRRYENNSRASRFALFQGIARFSRTSWRACRDKFELIFLHFAMCLDIWNSTSGNFRSGETFQQFRATSIDALFASTIIWILGEARIAFAAFIARRKYFHSGIQLSKCHFPLCEIRVTGFVLWNYFSELGERIYTRRFGSATLALFQPPSLIFFPLDLICLRDSLVLSIEYQTQTLSEVRIKRVKGEKCLRLRGGMTADLFFSLISRFSFQRHSMMKNEVTVELCIREVARWGQNDVASVFNRSHDGKRLWIREMH